MGGPFLGVLCEHQGQSAVYGDVPAVLVGLELAYLWEDLKAALLRLQAQLGVFLRGSAARAPLERRFVREFCQHLGEWLTSRAHPLARAEDRLQRVLDALREHFAWSQKTEQHLRALLGGPLGVRRSRTGPELRRLRALDLQLARPEQGFVPRLFAFECLELPPPDKERLTFLNQEIERLDACQDPEDLLAQLTDTEKRIAAYLPPSGTPCPPAGPPPVPPDPTKRQGIRDIDPLRASLAVSGHYVPQDATSARFSGPLSNQ